MSTTTVRLSNVLKNSADIQHILEDSAFTSPTLQDHLAELLAQTSKRRSEVIRQSALDPSYAYQIFSGRRLHPSRDQVIALAFGFALDSREANRLLRAAVVGTLHPKNKRDAVLINSLENAKTLDQTNEILFTLTLPTLGA